MLPTRIALLLALSLWAGAASAQVLMADNIVLREGTQNRDDPFVQFMSNGGQKLAKRQERRF